MLQFLYDELRSRKFKTLDISDIDTLDKLYALVITRWCASLAKEGLYKEYVEIDGEEMTSPRGQINVQETIARQTRLRGSIVCNYDELSGDIPINHVLKGTMQYLLDKGNLDKNLKDEVTKSMQLFNGIDTVDVDRVRWNDIKFNNNNIRYKHLIELCRTLLSEQKLKVTDDIDDNKRLYLLFKKQITKWFVNEYGEEDNVDTFIQPFTFEDESPLELKINKVQRLVAISTEKEALLVCIRLQDERLLDDNSLARKHKEELVGYMREYKKTFKEKVFGCVVYINTDKTKLNLQPITVTSFKDYMVGETVIDIHDQWRFVETKLKDVYTFFIEREKNKVTKLGAKAIKNKQSKDKA